MINSHLFSLTAPQQPANPMTNLADPIATNDQAKN